MRYFILFFILLFSYLMIHLYYSFCQGMSPWMKVFVLFVFAITMLFGFAIHPLEWALNVHFSEGLKFAANLMTAFLLNMAFAYFLFDILKICHIYPSSFLNYGGMKEGAIVAGLAIVICVVGYINALEPVAMNYKIKSSKVQSEMLIAVISDLHIGSFNMTPQKLQKAVDKINARNPDIVVIVGDLFDGRSPEGKFVQNNYADIFRDIKSKYGVFAVTGNHEYYTSNPEGLISLVEKSNVKVLRDDFVYIPSLNLYLIGREDRTKASFKALKDIISFANANAKNNTEKENALKIAVVHNPVLVGESVENGMDVQISGHTHNGQLFPFNLILKFMYEVTWGLKKIEDTTLFVSSGLGMWGPPIRTSAVSEVAFVYIVPE